MSDISDLPLFAGEGVSALQSLDDVLAVGWPYHGIAIMREATRGALTSRQFIMPDWPALNVTPPIPAVARAVLDGSPDVLPVRVQNQDAPWDYFFLANGGHFADLYILDPEFGEDQYVAIPMGTPVFMGEWAMGVPLRTPSDRFLNVNAWVRDTTIYVSSVPYNMRIAGMDPTKHPLGKFEMTHSLAGTISHHVMSDFDPRTPVRLTDNPALIRFRARILDYSNNKMLIAIHAYATGNSREFVTQEVDRDGLDPARDYRYRQMGSSVIRSSEQSDPIVCIYEYILSGETAKDATLTLIASPQDCEGVAVRVSPAESTIEHDPAGLTLEATKRTYQHTASQHGAVLSAYYNADGAVEIVRYSAEHTCQITHDGLYKGEYWTQNAIFESTLSVAGITKHIRQEITHEFDYANMPPGWDSSVGYVGHPWIIVRNKIFDNGVLLVDESIAGHDHDLIIRPVSINNLSGGRAPFIGYECRSVIGVAYNYPSADEFFNMSQYSVTLRDNGGGTFVLYSVLDNFAYNDRLPNKKRISDCHVISRFGNHTIPAFEDTVVYLDDRYARQIGAAAINFTDLAILKGYLGAKLRGVVNPVTGELYVEHVDRPLDQNRWM